MFPAVFVTERMMLPADKELKGYLPDFLRYEQGKTKS